MSRQDTNAPFKFDKIFFIFGGKIMSDWEESKQNFIDKLGNADRIFDEIFKIDSEGLVIQGDEHDELKTLQAANKKILNKR